MVELIHGLPVDAARSRSRISTASRRPPPRRTGPVTVPRRRAGRGACRVQAPIPRATRRAGRAGAAQDGDVHGKMRRLAVPRAGDQLPADQPRHASSTASCRRCAATRVSSGPAFCPARPAPPSAPPRTPRSGPSRSRPAPPNVVRQHGARSSNPSLSGPGWSGRGGEPSPSAAAPDHADPRRPAPAAAKSRPPSARRSPGSLSVQSQISRRQQHGKLALRERGGDHRVTRRRRAHPAAAAAAPLVTRVIARSEDPGPETPSQPRTPAGH